MKLKRLSSFRTFNSIQDQLINVFTLSFPLNLLSILSKINVLEAKENHVMVCKLSILSKINGSEILLFLFFSGVTFNSIQDQRGTTPLAKNKVCFAFNSIQDQQILLFFQPFALRNSFNSIQDQRPDDTDDIISIPVFQFYPRSTSFSCTQAIKRINKSFNSIQDQLLHPPLEGLELNLTFNSIQDQHISSTSRLLFFNNFFQFYPRSTE